MAHPLVTVPARALATAGGAGYSPVAPGTCGTAVAVPLAWLASSLPLGAFIAITAAITLAGVWAASVSDAHWGTHDSGRIVIDEVAGFFVTMCFAAPGSIGSLLLGFVLFRAFDIVKPPPVRWIDRAAPGGVGVVFDDVAAGLYAGLILLGLMQTSLPARIDALFG